MHRAAVLSAIALVCCSAILPALGQDEVRVRIMAANTSSGPHQSYPEDGPGEQIFRAFKPDVVLIQEFNLEGGNTESDLRSWVDEVFGSDYHFCREVAGGQSSIPNGIISRWPIAECGEWEDPFMSNRDFAYALVDLPGETDLWAVSVHLKASSGSKNRARRTNEAQALAEAIRQHPVPAEDYLVIGGDFNAQNRSEPFLQQLTSQVVIAPPFPHDRDNDGDTNCSRRKPYDWVLADPDLASIEAAVNAFGGTFPNGFVFDPSDYAQAELDSEFESPLERFDCGGSNSEEFRNFQHMAVIRDFLLTGHEAGAEWTVSDPREIDFGLRDASDGQVSDSSLHFSVQPEAEVRLTSVAIGGEHKDEFSFQGPGTGRLSNGQALTVTWTPASNDAEIRSAHLLLNTDSQPTTLRVDLRGETVGETPGGEGQPLDVSGFTLEQSGGSVSLQLPPDTTLKAGAVVVIGRKASREQFESFWGALPAEAVYFNGHELAGGDGFPVINGSERFRLVGRDGQPLGDFLPAGSTPPRHSYRRQSTGSPSFDRLDNPVLTATPGRYDGLRAATGNLVVTEFSDAPGSGNWIFEFVELIYDGSP